MCRSHLFRRERNLSAAGARLAVDGDVSDIGEADVARNGRRRPRAVAAHSVAPADRYSGVARRCGKGAFLRRLCFAYNLMRGYGWERISTMTADAISGSGEPRAYID